MAATDETEGAVREGRSRVAVAGAIAGGLVLVGLGALWVEREPIVAHYADRALGERRVPARYRIAAIGPFAQRLEDVSIGDPRAPDLVARAIELRMGYGLHGPHLVAVAAEGVRLSARIVDGRLSLGAIDRLLPASTGGPVTLPDIAVTLDDAVATLDAPAGRVIARIVGAGGLADGFRGRMTAASDRLAAGGCRASGVAADVSVRIDDRHPRLAGPLSLAALACPGVATGAGRADIGVVLAPALDRWRGGAIVDGFAGRAGATRFGALGGGITLGGTVRRIEGTTHLRVAGLAQGDVAAAAAARADGRYRLAPGTAGLVYSGALTLEHARLGTARRRAIARAGTTLAQTPLGPIAARAAAAAARATQDAHATMQVALTAGGPAGLAARVRRLDLLSVGGAHVTVSEGGGFGWNVAERGWRADGRIVAGGGGLPDLDVTLSQPRAGAPVSGLARMAPYAAAGARLALAPVRVTAGRATRFETVATIDGPIAGGRIEGLRVPLAGRIARGDVTVGEGCADIGFRTLALSGVVFAPGRLRACGVGGAPILAVRGGTVRAALAIERPRLSGHTGSAPFTLAGDRVGVDARGFVATALAARVGAGEAPTRLDIGRLDGAFGRGIAGGFADLGGRIGQVPLVMTGGAGHWRFADGRLALDGALAVSDAQADAPRFRPLAARDATLSLVGGRIAADATLAEPKTDAAVATVAIHHDLGTGTGDARIAVPHLVFDKRLQPEMLTPLTLGVVANVAGRVTGEGRIDWNAKGVTSSGTFTTDRLDLAAAFGPVEGIRGTIRFSDLLGLVTPPGQVATVAEVNPGVAVTNGTVRYRLLPGQRIGIEDARWPFAAGTLTLDPTVLAFDDGASRRMTFRLTGLDAAAFVQQLALPNLSATGTFDGRMPMVFDRTGGRIEGGAIVARPPGGTIAYVGELSRESIGMMGKLAFDALKAIRYSSLSIALDGRLDGEIVSRVAFTGVRQATRDKGIAARMIHNLPFRFNIAVKAPFRALVGTARSYADPSLLLPQAGKGETASAAPTPTDPSVIQPPASEPVR